MKNRESIWNRAVLGYLRERFHDRPKLYEYYLNLWQSHLAAGLVTQHFVGELTNGSEEKFSQRAWEMSLARHLKACGHVVQSPGAVGPDFRIDVGGKRIWIEAISPTPGYDLPPYWTKFSSRVAEPTLYEVPNTAMLLRWTSAFRKKSNKYEKYLLDGIVQEGQSYIIAIDSSQLSYITHNHGASRFPFVVEMVFALGPLVVELEGDTRKIIGSSNSTETSILNRNAAAVRKEPFLSNDFTGISAIVGCYNNVTDSQALPLYIAYNPHAAAPIPAGLFGADSEEWTAELEEENEDTQNWALKRL